MWREHGQPQGEAASAAVALSVGNVAAVGAGDLAGESQTEARALDAVAQGIVRAIELLEDLLAAASRDAQAAIKNADFHVCAKART